MARDDKLTLVPREPRELAAASSRGSTSARAQADLGASMATMDSVAPSSASDAHPPRPAPDPSELRNVTVLIADVVQSTRTVLNFEPDDARAYLDRAIQSMLAGVRKFGGSIVSTQGDNVLAVFGTPTSTEDHALRACLAATEIRDAFLSLPAFAEGVETRVRIGVHSGGVWTKPRRVGETEEHDANGAVVHVASKIERMCPP